jgi:hypothetical protein
MSTFFCPGCGWEGIEDKPLKSIPCPVCREQAMSLDVQDEDIVSQGTSHDIGARESEALEGFQIVEGDDSSSLDNET